MYRLVVRYFGDRIVDALCDAALVLAKKTKTQWDDELAEMLSANRSKLKDLLRTAM